MNTKNKKYILFFISFIVACNLYIFGTFTIYAGNQDYFNIPYSDALKYLFIPFLLTISCLFAPGLIMKDNGRTRYITILAAVGLLLWFESNVIVWRYGVLDGSKFDWSSNAWYGLVDGSAWLTLLALSVLYPKRLYKNIILACVILFALQTAQMGTAILRNPGIFSSKSNTEDGNRAKTLQDMYSFSPEKNVIQIVMDSFQTDIFQDIIDEDSAYYHSTFDGFTLFREANATAPKTYLSIPSILSGNYYSNQMEMIEYVNASLEGNSVSNALYESSYHVDLAHKHIHYKKGKYSSFYQIPPSAGNLKDSQTALLLDLTLFRALPHYLKKPIYNEGLWFIQAIANKNDEFQKTAYYANYNFMQELINNLDIKRDKPTYKFIHLMTPHQPIVVDQRCEYAGEHLKFTRLNTLNQQRCSLKQLIDFLNKLKEKGIYDSSLIIIHADHGSKQDVNLKNLDTPHNALIRYNRTFPQIVGYAAALLAVKPPESKGDMKISDAQVSLDDIPATIDSFLNLKESFPGKSVFDVGANETRVRRLHFSNEYNLSSSYVKDYFDRLDDFEIKGSLFDRNSWSMGQTYFRPGTGPMFITRNIDFNDRSANKFLRSGWKKTKSIQGDQTWAVGHKSSLFISLPRDRYSQLTARVISPEFSNPQTINLRLDGKKIGEWKVSTPRKLSTHSIVIKPDGARKDNSVIEFEFSEFKEAEFTEFPVALIFHSISLSDIDPQNQRP